MATQAQTSSLGSCEVVHNVVHFETGRSKINNFFKIYICHNICRFLVFVIILTILNKVFNQKTSYYTLSKSPFPIQYIKESCTLPTTPSTTYYTISHQKNIEKSFTLFKFNVYSDFSCTYHMSNWTSSSSALFLSLAPMSGFLAHVLPLMSLGLALTSNFLGNTLKLLVTFSFHTSLVFYATFVVQCKCRRSITQETQVSTDDTVFNITM